MTAAIFTSEASSYKSNHQHHHHTYLDNVDSYSYDAYYMYKEYANTKTKTYICCSQDNIQKRS